jgi:hypothetical protein
VLGDLLAVGATGNVSAAAAASLVTTTVKSCGTNQAYLYFTSFVFLSSFLMLNLCACIFFCF